MPHLLSTEASILLTLIDRALEVAAVAHRNQVRKGTDVPYISHPAAVALLLAKAGCSDEVVAAGMLHDTVEDTYITLADIEREFGPEVAAIVAGCSEPAKSVPWEARKEHTLAHLRSASWEVRAVSCADKLHNVRSTLAEFERYGEGVWTRFKRGRDKQEWYYRSLVEVLCSDPPGGKPVPYCEDLRREVDRLFGPAPM
jgi:(p)ppGpp synthase/HD superfamily hydrolase